MKKNDRGLRQKVKAANGTDMYIMYVDLFTFRKHKKLERSLDRIQELEKITYDQNLRQKRQGQNIVKLVKIDKSPEKITQVLEAIKSTKKKIRNRDNQFSHTEEIKYEQIELM